MKLIIRYIRNKGQGEEIEQASFKGDRLLIGRGTDQDIHLPGVAIALSHAQIVATKKGFKVSSSKGNKCIYQGRLLDSFALAVGDEFGISGHTIKCLPGIDDADAVLELHIESDSQEQLQDRFHTRIADLNINKRGWSWILFVSILSIGLLIPVSGLLSPLWMDIVRDSALPDDSIWSSGELHRSHRFIAEQCDQCHVEPFAQVADEQCQSCHSNISHHLDAHYYGMQAEQFAECTDCHKEHSESFDLSAQSQKICATCHADLEQDGLASIKYQAATDFETVHPNFMVSILTPQQNDDAIDWVISRLPLATPNLQEQSHLKFSHQLHMAADGINGPSGKEVLQCDTCHQVEAGGTVMQPVRMDQHCQQCHQLSFDPDDPSRTVPHGSAEEVVVMLREYYGFRYVYRHLLAQEKLTEQDVGDLFEVRDARRPGRQKEEASVTSAVLNAETAKAIEDLTKQGVRTDALQWAESRAFEAASSLFEKQACQTCHEVTVDENQSIPWQVKPIRLTKHWFPLAKFSHEKHELMSCIDCHAATTSDVSHDVLMPDLQNCRQCHGGENSRNLIPSSCTECHEYHFDVGSLVPDFVKADLEQAVKGSDAGND